MPILHVSGNSGFAQVANVSLQVIQAGGFRVPAFGAQFVAMLMISEVATRALSGIANTFGIANSSNLFNNYIITPARASGVDLRPYEKTDMSTSHKLLIKGVATLALAILWTDLATILFGEPPKHIYQTILSPTSFSLKEGLITKRLFG